MDDEHTWHVELTSYWFPEDVEVPPQERVPYRYVPLKTDDGRWRGDDTIGQDHTAWVMQGSIAERDKERLGESDVGLVAYRKQLLEQMHVVQDGGEPINVFRDPALNVLVHNQQEGWGPIGGDADVDEIARYGSQLKEQVREMACQTRYVSAGTI